MFHMWDTGIGWWMGFGWIWMIVFWGGLIALIVWGVHRLTQRDGPSSKRGALDIARERYAEGEISGEEFNQLKNDLS